MKTILYSVLLILPFLATIACDSKSSTSGSTTHITFEDDSLDAQLVSIEFKITELEKQKKQIEISQSENIRFAIDNELQLRLKNTDNFFEDSELKVTDAGISRAELSPAHPLVKEMLSAQVELNKAKEDMKAFKTHSKELSKEALAVDAELIYNSKVRDILSAKIRIKTNKKILSSLNKIDADSIKALIVKDETLVEKVQKDILKFEGPKSL